MSPQSDDVARALRDLVRNYDKYWSSLDFACLADLWERTGAPPIYLGDEYAAPLVGNDELDRHWARVASRVKTATMSSALHAFDVLDDAVGLQATHPAELLRQGDDRVGPVQLVEIDLVDAQPPPRPLTRTDHARRMARFYVLDVQPDLFGAWCFIREWGRIGRPGQLRQVPYPTEDKAKEALARQRHAKEGSSQNLFQNVR